MSEQTGTPQAIAAQIVRRCQDALTCRHDSPHYCPNCDNSIGPERLTGLQEAIASALTQQAEIANEARLRSAVLWALGEEGEFPEQPEAPTNAARRYGRPRFWWRAELRRRAFGEASAQAQQTTNAHDDEGTRAVGLDGPPAPQHAPTDLLASLPREELSRRWLLCAGALDDIYKMVGGVGHLMHVPEAVIAVQDFVRKHDEWKALAAVGTWHKDCRPNRHKAAQELQKSQAIIDKLADRIAELEAAHVRTPVPDTKGSER